MKVEESKTVPDGRHTGEIVDVVFDQRGDEGFPYVDVAIKDTETGVTIKAGYAASRVTPETELGRLLRRFGFEPKVGQNVDWSVLKNGTQVSFATETEKKKTGKFARILLETVKPIG